MYDAILLVSFGGPEAREDVIPFLENVLRGRNVPRERMLSVAEHYYHFGGVSPINEQNRKLISALQKELAANALGLPIYWGNRNWHPLLADAIRKMRDDGIKRALAFVTAGYSSYSSCRHYRENIAAAQEEVGTGAPQVDKLRLFYNHPGFVEANAEGVRQALNDFPASRRDTAELVFTAHSIPLSMAQNCDYEEQLLEAAKLVREAVPHPSWMLSYQSRSGSPAQSWLGPDILECIRGLKQKGTTDLVVAPIGFVSDHMEVVFDLDVEAKKLCDELGINMVRAATAGTHPSFVRMIRDLIVERIDAGTKRQVLGDLGPWPDLCPVDCCLPRA
jgi:protoporphyrin/coproporphyrin ferrochelatase